MWDRDGRIPKPLIEALIAEPDLRADEVGDNEPYDGALAGDTIDEIATSRGLANVLIEIRQDLIAERSQRARVGRTHRPRVARPSSPIGGHARPPISAVARGRRLIVGENPLPQLDAE